MKKTPLLVALPVLALSSLLLSGCGMFRSHKAWDTAQQQAPLEIPPSLNRPTTSAALVIPPPGGNQPTANGATASVNGSGAGSVTDGFIMPDTVDNSYRRVGVFLATAGLGVVSAHDDAAHSYTVNVTNAVIQQKKTAFFSFFRKNTPAVTEPAGGGAHPVLLTIDTSGTDASEVRAQGDAAAVAKVVDAMRSKLSKKVK